MAQKVQVLFVDDVDGSDADETVSFGLDGVHYEIDVSGSHALELRGVLASWLEHARRTGGRSSRSAAKSRPDAGKEDLTAMRVWARENGFEVSDRGRLSREVHAAWNLRDSTTTTTTTARAAEPVESEPVVAEKVPAKKRSARIEAAFSG